VVDAGEEHTPTPSSPIVACAEISPGSARVRTRRSWRTWCGGT
jgi:hypothetical protein